ncbi:EF-hand domain-containing protein [Pseudomonas nitroreducens]|uniref:EF-hand domain-containing protein n=1 Tax=Pseudomonas nitroreducens TaxID=46680 RepID=A0A246FDD4_PSENT|nr:EF-hand domain-containing protein [Pseudomonas nitroreducens]OWP51440.1 hypothetical protein CEG18_11345 [Pseudomonas nitroreducens]
MISGVSSYSSYYTGSTLARTQTASSSTGTQAGNCGGNQGAAKFQEDLFKSIDSDGDDNLTKDELTSALSSGDSDSSIDVDDLLAQLDSDGSGGVSQDELSAAMPPPPPGGMGGPGGVANAGGSGEELISALDTNGDGVISTDELAAAGKDDASDPLSQVFSQLDADGSGGDEPTSAFQAQRQGDGPPPPPPSASQPDTGSHTTAAYQKLVANLLKQYQSSDATALQATSGSLVNIAA